MPRPARLPELPAGPPPGWVRLSEAADRAGVGRIAAWRWVRDGLIPFHRVNAKRCYVDPAAAAALAHAWPCPACGNYTPGPSALAAHVRAFHPEAHGPWRCSGPDCSTRARATQDLARHLDAHAEAYRAAGIRERTAGAVPGPRRAPRPCKRKGCNLQARAAGFCPTHYQAARRARMKRAGGKA